MNPFSDTVVPSGINQPFFFQCILLHIISSFILRSSRAPVSPGSSIQVTVTGLINRDATSGTKATIEFLAHPYRRTYPIVNRAVYLLIGVPHVSTKVTFTLLMLNCHRHFAASKAKILYGHIY
jgi:hypothetical protein